MPDVFGNVESVYKQHYSRNVELATQVLMNPFEGFYTPLLDIRGKEMQAVELIGARNIISDAPEFAPTPNVPPRHEGIWVRPRKGHDGVLISEEAKLKSLMDYTGPYTKAMAAGFARWKAGLIVDTLFGPRLISNDDTGAISTVAFDSANRTVAVNYVPSGAAANSNLTIPKIIKALELIGFAEVDIAMKSVCMFMTMKQNTSLYNTIQITNQQYAGKYQLQEKVVTSFMGVQIKIWNSLPVDASGYRKIPIYVSDGLHCGDVSDMAKDELEKNPGQQYRWHLYSERWWAGTRSEDEKFAVILCDETVA